VAKAQKKGGIPLSTVIEEISKRGKKQSKEK
jgi:hypothetical protein